MKNCIIKNCNKEILNKKNNLCIRHYSNLINYGDPIPQRDKNLKDRIEKIGWKMTNVGCWEWKGSINDSGYGVITIKRLGLIKSRVHRLMVELKNNKKIPKDKVVCHKCNNPICINPEHLYIGTQQDNINDMCQSKRHWAYNRTSCKNGHNLKLVGAIKKIKHNDKFENICIKCDIIRKRKWYLKNMNMSSS